MENLPKKVRSKKLNTRVDLTAMVSVSFLLIIFFMVTIELAKPKSLYLNGEHGCCDCYRECNKPDENRILTILLDDNNKIITYMGILYSPVQNPKEVKYGKDGIRKELISVNKKVYEYSANKGYSGKGVTVIIKPSKKSSYGNLVDILDEMRINNIKSYGIVDYFTPEESKLLAYK
jgi:biopolymer transport protein ExbD